MAQDFDGVCCQQRKMNPLERLAYEFDQIVTHMARNSWENAISLKEDDWPFAAFLLRHSLQDNPDDLHFPAHSKASELVRNTPEYQKVLEQIREELKNTDLQQEGTLTLQFNSGDLYVALHNTTLRYSADKIDGKWHINIIVSDCYDFAHHSKEEISSFKYRTINNMAYSDQQMGIINNYDISFEIIEDLD